MYADGHAACTLLATHPKPTACKTSGNCYTCVMNVVQLHGIKKEHLFSKKAVPTQDVTNQVSLRSLYCVCVCVCVYEYVCKKITLNWIINTEDVNVKTGFHWLRIRTIAGSENKVRKLQFCINREFFNTLYNHLHCNDNSAPRHRASNPQHSVAEVKFLCQPISNIRRLSFPTNTLNFTVFSIFHVAKF